MNASVELFEIWTRFASLDLRLASHRRPGGTFCLFTWDDKINDMTEQYKIPESTKIGHIHLTVGNLERSLAFYRDLLGFEVTTTYGHNAAFLSAGAYHHHIALNTWAGKGATPPPKGHSGMFHHAILYPSRLELAKILRRLLDANYPITGFADHGVSEAIYLNDPDEIGVELYCDRPKEQWKYNSDGTLIMGTEPLNIESLLREI